MPPADDDEDAGDESDEGAGADEEADKGSGLELSEPDECDCRVNRPFNLRVWRGMLNGETNMSNIIQNKEIQLSKLRWPSISQLKHTVDTLFSSIHTYISIHKFDVWQTCMMQTCEDAELHVVIVRALSMTWVEWTEAKTCLSHVFINTWAPPLMNDTCMCLFGSVYDLSISHTSPSLSCSLNSHDQAWPHIIMHILHKQSYVHSSVCSKRSRMRCFSAQSIWRHECECEWRYKWMWEGDQSYLVLIVHHTVNCPTTIDVYTKGKNGETHTDQEIEWENHVRKRRGVWTKNSETLVDENRRTTPSFRRVNDEYQKNMYCQQQYV